MTRLASPNLLSAFTARPTCLWRFDQPGTTCYISHTASPITLHSEGIPAARHTGGPFGSYLAFRGQSWLTCPRQAIGPLDVHGTDAAVSVFAWLRPRGDEPWQFVAGVWDESQSKRQYGLFFNAAGRTLHSRAHRVPAHRQVHGHVSHLGGPTPGRNVCTTYASGATELPDNAWACIGMTYDGHHARVYVNGQLDALDDANPFPYPFGLFNAGRNGAPFHVSANSVAGRMHNFLHADLAMLAVWTHALENTDVPAMP